MNNPTNIQKKIIAKFTNRELEYIYNYLDIDVNYPLFRKIEAKCRKQITKYREIDKSRKK